MSPGETGLKRFDRKGLNKESWVVFFYFVKKYNFKPISNLWDVPLNYSLLEKSQNKELAFVVVGREKLKQITRKEVYSDPWRV
jgi:hypothetical protein